MLTTVLPIWEFEWPRLWNLKDCQCQLVDSYISLSFLLEEIKTVSCKLKDFLNAYWHYKKQHNMSHTSHDTSQHVTYFLIVISSEMGHVTQVTIFFDIYIYIYIYIIF